MDGTKRMMGGGGGGGGRKVSPPTVSGGDAFNLSRRKTEMTAVLMFPLLTSTEGEF